MIKLTFVLFNLKTLFSSSQNISVNVNTSLGFSGMLVSTSSKDLEIDYLEKERGKDYVGTHQPWTYCIHFKFIRSVSYSLQRWIQVQINVSIRYLSFARKTFSIGLLLLNTMARSAHREIKEMCLPLPPLVICAVCSGTVTLYGFCLVSVDFLSGPEIPFEITEK